VTFIVGLNCKNGLVLCADSLEADGYNKRNVQKLFKHEAENEWGLAFGCSGTGAACTNFSDRLLELIDDQESYDRRGTEKLIEATIAYMKRQYPDESLDVILGLWGINPAETRLYRAQSNTQCLSVEIRRNPSSSSIFLVSLPADHRRSASIPTKIARASILGQKIQRIPKDRRKNP
jgi:20S proteasome alpha/beta subunit